MVCVHARQSELEKMGAPALSKLVLAQMDRIEHLELMVAKLQRQHFGPKSEKAPINADQLMLSLSGTVIEAQPVAQAPPQASEDKTTRPPRKSRALPPHICGVKSERIFPSTPHAPAATESCASSAKMYRRCWSTCRPASS